VATPALTICTVSFRHGNHLAVNTALTRRLNPAAGVRWVIVDNAPGPDAPPNPAAADVRVLPGPPPDPAKKRPGSYHHGLGLNRAVERADTRYVLVLDPDFYIVRPGWVRDVLAHADARRLAFFGAPWHPRWVIKYRYFPCVHCMLIDLDRVDRRALDFTPPQDDGPDVAAAAAPVGGRLGFLVGLVLGRRNVGRSRDTGSRVHARFGPDPRFRRECVAPVWPPPADPFDLNPVYRTFNRVIDLVCPDRLSYVPKRRGYVTPHPHPGAGPARTRNWEYFSWRGAPFGFHIRGMAQADRDPDGELPDVERNLTRYPGAAG
jgi:hypothetical protein